MMSGSTGLSGHYISQTAGHYISQTKTQALSLFTASAGSKLCGGGAKEANLSQDRSRMRSRLKQKPNFILKRESNDIQSPRIYPWRISPLPLFQSATKEDISINDEQNRNQLMPSCFTQAY
jgi:hypothetical protein